VIRTFSIYLDATRFLAALAVLLHHASKDRFSGQWLQSLWEMQDS
jgi:peptidoglycan/LPS O-acetylase OafA/YrhL